MIRAKRNLEKKFVRFSFSPSHKVRADGRAKGTHHATENSLPAKPVPSPVSSTGSSTPLASDSPDAKRVKFSPSQQEQKKTQKQEQSKFISFLGEDPNAAYANSNAVKNQLVHCTKTPLPDKRRFYDMFTVVACALDRVAAETFKSIKWSREDRKERMRPHVEKYFGFGSNGGGGGLEKKTMNLLKDTAEQIESLSPKERRPVMAMLSKHFTRADVQSMMASNISAYEWREARKHSKYPGPYKPVEKPKTTRARFDIGVVVNFLDHLQLHSQGHAYGAKNAQTSAGVIVQLDAVSTTAQPRYIMRDYIEKHHPERLIQVEGGCDKRCPKVRVYCLKKEGHGGQHKFTDDNMLSASSIESIIEGLTAGRLKSMAGLDDEDVNKGSANIARLKEIFSVLVSANNIDPSKVKTVNEQIDEILTYGRTGFISHLQRYGDRCCQCISCGLHCKDDPIECPFRDRHKGTCNDCEKSFGVFSYLFDLTQATKNLEHVKVSDKLTEQYNELEVELKQCQTYFIHWRSHIVRKVVEGQFFRQELQNLGSDEAICQCDFKMKIVASSLKETKQQFFGKRGTACLGFMLMSNVEQKEGVVDVHFYLFFSDDTTQDTNFVLAAKHHVYNNIVPSLFPKNTQVKVKFESDGAGCFNSYLAKAAMPFWDEWTDGKVVESQIRHSVNGDGKSSLDGMFGKLGRNLKDAVENGITDISDARSCLKAYDEGAGIEGSSAFLLEIERESDMEVEKKYQLPILLKSHRIVYEPENNRVVAYRHSDYGNGTEIGVDSIKRIIKGSPEKPKYTVSSSTGGNAGTSHHPTESYQSRLHRAAMSKREATNNALIAKEDAKLERAMQNGLMFCDARQDVTRNRCSFNCTSKKALAAHKISNNHHFPSRNLKDQSIAITANEGGIFQFGSRPNRSQEYANHTASDGQGPASSSDAHFSLGCYCKPSRKKPEKWTDELKQDLIAMYEAGESAEGEDKQGKNKYTTKAALDRLRSMHNKAGLLKYSSTSEFGELPTEQQIKGFWYRYKESRNKKSSTSREEQNKDDEYVNAALDTIDEENDEEHDDNAETDNQVKPSKKRRAPAKTRKNGKFSGNIFLINGNFEAYVDDIQDFIVSNGGKILKNLTKNVDFVVMGDNPEFCLKTKLIQLKGKGKAIEYKAKPIKYSQLQLVLDDKASFESLEALDGNHDAIQPSDTSSEIHRSHSVGMCPDEGSRPGTDDETISSDVHEGFCVQGNSYGIEVSPAKGNRLFH